MFGCSRPGAETHVNQIVFDDTTSVDNLKPVDSLLLIKWKISRERRRYFKYFEYFHIGGKFHSEVIKVTGDDYSALVLMTFDSNGDIIDKYEIAGGDCGGPTEFVDKIDLCPYLKSVMISENEFIIRQIRQFTTDTVNWVVTEKDSTEWRILIDEKGRINKKQ